MTGRQIGSLVWIIVCVVVGLLHMCTGLPEVRERIRAGKGTPEDMARLKRKRFDGGCLIVGPGLCLGLPGLLD